jgi:hypothetical protein
MTALDKALSLRPANVAHRLGGSSRLPLLNAADLLRALPPSQALATLPAVAQTTVAGILRAAREENAVVGIALAPSPERNRASALFASLLHRAEEGRHRLPFFVQAGPFDATSSDARELALLGRAIFDHVEAGATLISVDASALPWEHQPVVMDELLRPALERELAVELVAPADPQTARTWLDGLLHTGIRPTFARCSSDAFTSGREVDFGRVGAWAAMLAEAGIAPSIELRGVISHAASAWTAAGIRKLEAGDELARGALARLPESMHAELAAGARTVATWRLLGAARDALDALEEGQQDRMEALTFGEAFELLGACGAAGAGKAAIDRLAELGPA